MRFFVLMIILILASCSTPSPAYYSDMAQCITDKGVKMYGAFWCPHCAKVKKAWGDSFQKLDYIECDPRGENAQTQKCLDDSIEKYATFRRPDGEELCCEPSPEELAAWVGCEVNVGS